jgi:hypothetical protein
MASVGTKARTKAGTKAGYELWNGSVDFGVAAMRNVTAGLVSW